MKILNRAKSFYSDEYFISQDIKFELEMMYLRVNGVWRECEESTRSVNFEDMLDSEGNKIFASLSEDGKGGDVIEREINMYLDDPRPHDGTYWVQTKCPILYKHSSIYIMYDIKDATPKFANGTITNRYGYKTISDMSKTKIIGIQE